MSIELSIVHHPDRCRALLSKGMYINAGCKPGEEVTGEGNFWCGKTQTIKGPDRKICDPEFCLDRNRSCFEAG